MTTRPLIRHLTAQLRQVLATCLIGGVALGSFAVISSISGCGESAPSGAASSTTKAVSPVASADGKKVVRIPFVIAESGFDPVTAHDQYSAEVIDGIFDTVLSYDYLARPSKLVPKLAAEMPLVEDEGKRWTIKLVKGAYFSPHEVFAGKKREVTANDVAYSFKRHFDDSLKPVWRFLIDGKIVGLNAWYEKGKKSDGLGWDEPVPGLEVLDSHTLRISLTKPDYNFGYVLAHVAMAVVAREVVEKYPNDVQSHPIGSSAYYLKEWVRGQRMVLEKNPYWRGGTWDFKPAPGDAYDEVIVKQMQGKPLAPIDRVEIYPIEEEQTRWLAFKNKQLDFINMPQPFMIQAFPDGKPGGRLAPDLAAQGVRVQSYVEPEYTYNYFQWSDPIWGGGELHKIALRRAAAMALNRDDEISIIRKNNAIRAEFIVPQGVVGHQANFKSNISYNPSLANALLDKFGYKKGADGFRMTPDGKPFTFKYTSTPTALEREFDELYSKNIEAIGIRYESEKEKFADSIKREKRCQITIRGAAWIADYPDGDNFTQLLYSKNIGESNNGCYKSAAYDKLYEQTTVLPDGPERDKLYMEMQKQFEADTPWVLGITRLRNQMVYPWVIGYKRHPVMVANWMYYDVNVANSGKGK